ncbi:MAG: hypothetical protein WCI51_19445 [Lentisphaerota bacterium]
MRMKIFSELYIALVIALAAVAAVAAEDKIAASVSNNSIVLDEVATVEKALGKLFSMPATGHEVVKPVLFASRAHDHVALDGNFNEGEWKNAAVFNSFKNMTSRAVQFTYKALYDDNYIYLGLSTVLANATGIQKQQEQDNAKNLKPDSWSSAYSYEIFLLPPGCPYFQYTYSMGKQKYDGQGKDSKWNGEWEAASFTSGNTWNMVFKIAVKPMGLEKVTENATWRINLIMYHNGKPVAVLGNMSNYHIIADFPELHAIGYAQWRKKVLSDADATLAKLQLPAEQATPLRALINLERRNTPKDFSEAGSAAKDFQYLGLISDAFGQFSAEAEYAKLLSLSKY